MENSQYVFAELVQDTMKNKEKQIIKELYKDFIEMVRVNNPDYYVIPLVFYDSIISRVQTIESELKRYQKARDNWKSRAEKAESKLKEFGKMNNKWELAEYLVEHIGGNKENNYKILCNFETCKELETSFADGVKDGN